MASPTRWTWVWVNSGSWWWTGRPGMLRFMGSQRVGHNWTTELNWIPNYIANRLNQSWAWTQVLNWVLFPEHCIIFTFQDFSAYTWGFCLCTREVLSNLGTDRSIYHLSQGVLKFIGNTKFIEQHFSPWEINKHAKSQKFILWFLYPDTNCSLYKTICHSYFPGFHFPGFSSPVPWLVCLHIMFLGKSIQSLFQILFFHLLLSP